MNRLQGDNDSVNTFPSGRSMCRGRMISRRSTAPAQNVMCGADDDDDDNDSDDDDEETTAAPLCA